MKTTVLIFLLLCYFDLIPCYTQVNIVTNGSFEVGCGTNDTTVHGCPTFSVNCLPVWKPSHGTPQLVTSGSADLNNHMRMWAGMAYGTSYSEGIYTQLSQVADYRYKYALCFWYKTSNHPGNFYFRLTNSVTRNVSDCGDVVASTGSYQTIYTGSFGNTDWTFVSFPFTPNANYDRLMIYPQSTQPTSNAATFYIDGISITSCAGVLDVDLTYPYLPLAGIHQRSGYIRAGSNIITSGNTTPVIVHPAINTALYSGTQVLLMDNFLTTPNNEQFFVAEIKNECLCTQTFDLGLRMQSSYPDNYAKEEGRLTEQYKKTVHGIPIVLPYPDETHYLARHSAVIRSIEVLDLAGRLLYREDVSEIEVIVNLSALADGIYIIRLTDGDGHVFPEKIRCQH